jgi:hypothetical protein
MTLNLTRRLVKGTPLTAAEHDGNLDKLEDGIEAAGTDLSYTAATRTLASSTGADVALPVATTSAAGLMASADKAKLDGIEAGAQENVGTDLSYTASSRLLASSTGADVTLPQATTTLAGLQSAADKTKLDSIAVDSATLVRKYVRNNSGVLIPKGAAVYQTGSSGTTLTVALADASTEATTSQTLGLAQEEIGINANGYVVAVGLLDGISTATLTEGQIVWLSETAGQLTTTRPTQPAHGVVCGYCVKQAAGAAGILYVKVDNGLELAELHDVLLSGATTGQVLRLASDGLWKNQNLPDDVIVIPVGDESTALTTGTNRIRFRMPFAATLLAVRANVNTAPTGSTLIVDVNEAGASVLGTKLSIDATEFSSTTAASAATITDSSLADDAEISIDIDQIGSTVAGAGLKVSLFVRRA